MSHFTKIKTKLKRQDWLLKILQKNSISAYIDSSVSASSIIIPQKNNINLSFEWNGSSYDLVADLEFWQQDLSFESFLQKIQNDYNYYNLLVQTEKLGFTTSQSKENINGSTTLTLQRFTV